MKKLNRKQIESFAKEIRKLIFKNLKEETPKGKNIKNIKIKNNKELQRVHDVLIGKLKKVKLLNKNMEEILSINESVLIIEDYTEKSGDYWFIQDSEKVCNDIAHDLFSRIINNTLSKLSSEGELECHYDSEENDFIFNVKEKEN
jgi:hypothetical protein